MKYLNNNDPWHLGEEIPDMDLFFAQIFLSAFGNEFKNPGGRAYKKIMSIFKGYHLWFYFGEQDSYQLGEHLTNKYVNHPQFAILTNKRIVAWSDKLRSLADKLPQENLAKLSNQELWDYYKKHDEVHTKYYQWGWLPVAVDMFHNNLTERAKQYLRSINVIEDKVNEYLVLLTQPRKKSLIQLEQEEFLKIADKIQKNRGKFNSAIYSQIEKHYQKYFYVKFLWIGKDGVNDYQDYMNELKKFLKSGNKASQIIKKLGNDRKKVLANRQKLIKKLKINRVWQMLFNSWGDFMVTKIYRRYAQIYAIYRIQPILKEIAKRLKITIKQAKFMVTKEIGQAMLKNKINRAELKERAKFCVYYVEKDVEEVFVGRQAKKLFSQIKQKDLSNITEIKGQTGCVGKATGTVKIIIRFKDMVKMNKGDILVSIATDPDIVPAMKKAAAIVTEQGGVTSHAAIVSREMNIPCVIGTKIATKVFKDGDRVEVDANHGIVKKI